MSETLTERELRQELADTLEHALTLLSALNHLPGINYEHERLFLSGLRSHMRKQLARVGDGEEA